ncbi:hypothetical protein PAHAL_9G473000 [Panicum hallii]|uniref:Uncharacterized protein n=1 Tax=Panicum hallii TaxID=206008 RepID=A0A2S3IRX1_9POAL|nr:hypothetical protein PAHAL_9G473000 [Panicum hallii]
MPSPNSGGEPVGEEVAPTDSPELSRRRERSMRPPVVSRVQGAAGETHQRRRLEREELAGDGGRRREQQRRRDDAGATARSRPEAGADQTYTQILGSRLLIAIRIHAYTLVIWIVIINNPMFRTWRRTDDGGRLPATMTHPAVNKSVNLKRRRWRGGRRGHVRCCTRSRRASCRCRACCPAGPEPCPQQQDQPEPRVQGARRPLPQRRPPLGAQQQHSAVSSASTPTSPRSSPPPTATPRGRSVGTVRQAGAGHKRISRRCGLRSAETTYGGGNGGRSEEELDAGDRGARSWPKAGD